MIVAALPAYNEEVTIGSVVLKALKHVDKVVVVDDASSDMTGEIARLAGAYVIKHERNKGYGGALKTCFEIARKLNAETLVILDADGQHDANDIPVVLKPIISKEADVVIGSRFIEKSQDKIPTYRSTGIKILNLAMHTIGVQVSDSQSGFRAYSKKAIDSINPTESGMSAGSEILAECYKNGLKIVEVPIHCSYEVDGSSQGPISHGLGVLSFILQLIGEERPLLFFAVPGVMIILIGGFLGYNVIQTYQNTNMLALGTAMITILLIIIGTLGIFTGMILRSISRLLNRHESRRKS